MSLANLIPPAIVLLAIGCTRSDPPASETPPPYVPPEPTKPDNTMQATKPSDTEILLAQTFSAPREVVFAALTQPEQVTRWMKPTHMTLVSFEADLRVGGKLRYVFQRPGGRNLEVLGIFEAVDAPAGFVYAETYDFSPLKVHVTTSLEAAGDKTVFQQRLRYVSKQERDEDYPGVATSSKEAYAGLERYLARQRK